MPDLESFKSITKYGRTWGDGKNLINHLDVEMLAFKFRLQPPLGLGPATHFRNICKALDPKYVWLSDFPEIPHEAQYNDRMLDACLATNWLSISGPASSGKSSFMARWVGINWLVHFGKCAVVVTSTTKAGARTRIWAHIKEFFQGIQGWFPFHLNDTSCIITVAKDSVPGFAVSDRAAIMLVTPEKDKAGSGDAKLIGLHNDLVMVAGDEYSDMSPALANACENLKSNPSFHAVFFANAKSIFDPHGQQCTPKDGNWKSVRDSDLTWETERGLCLHLDGLNTPNQYTEPQDKFPYLQKWSYVLSEQEAGRANTSGFWRYIRAFWPPQGHEDALYNEMELLQYGCMDHAIWQGGGIIELAGFDPGNKSGGDNWQACFAKLGTDKDGKRVLDFTEMKALYEDVSIETESISKQVAKQFVAECKKRNIHIRQVAVDCSGGGSHMANYIEDEFLEKGIFRVEFGARASEVVVDNREGKDVRACDRFGRRDAELWHAGIPFVKSGQLKGITSKQAEQMTKRRGFTQNRLQYVESKVEFKSRTKLSSPDEADSGFLVISIAMIRFGFQPNSLIQAKRGPISSSPQGKFANLNAKASAPRSMRWG